MARRTTTLQAKATGSTKRLAIGLLGSTSSLWTLCSKQASRVAKKLILAEPPSISRFIRHKKRGPTGLHQEEADHGGLWKRSILMGEKCEPLDFSGVIYYDRNGKQLDEVPVRSPRASPLPRYLYGSGATREKGF